MGSNIALPGNGMARLGPRVTGDYRYRTFGPFEPALTAMASLRRHLQDPVYAVLGNHDSIRMVPSLELMGIRALLNESVALKRKGATIRR